MRPLESAVILSPEGDSYKLYARDIVKHPLTAYLVTFPHATAQALNLMLEKAWSAFPGHSCAQERTT